MLEIWRLPILLLMLVVAAFGHQVKTAKADDNPYFDKPGAAQQRSEAFKNGLAAAKSEDWKKAEEWFRKAIVPQHILTDQRTEPRVYYNLALALDRMGGRELAAVGYYRAYIALKPNTKITPAVRKRADELFATAKENMLQLLKIIEKSAMEFPEGSFHQNEALSDIAEARAFMGDLSGAMAVYQRLNYAPHNKFQKRTAYESILYNLAWGGEPEKAKTLLRKMKKPENYSEAHGTVMAWENIGKQEAMRNRIEEALNAADEIARIIRSLTDEPGTTYPTKENFLSSQVNVYFEVIDGLIKNEDFQRAKTFLSQTRQIARSLGNKFFGQSLVVNKLMDLGEVDEAEHYINKLPPVQMRSCAITSLSIGFLMRGRLDEARGALEQIPAETTVCPRNSIDHLIDRQEKEIEQFKSRLKEAVTEQERVRIKEKLDSMFRPDGPVRNEFRRIVPPHALARAEANVWENFGNSCKLKKATDNFRKFIQSLQGKSEYVLMSAKVGLDNMLQALHRHQYFVELIEIRRKWVHGK